MIANNATDLQLGGKRGCQLYLGEDSIDTFARLVAAWSQRCGVPILMTNNANDGTALADQSQAEADPSDTITEIRFDIITATWRCKGKEDGE